MNGICRLHSGPPHCPSANRLLARQQRSKDMRKLLIAAALISSAATAAPALAQPGYGHGPAWVQLRPRVDALLRDLNTVDQRIQVAIDRRLLSPREAFALRRESNQIRFAITRQGR